jgi:2-acylglycerol O-acyltransferase 2
MTTFSNAALMKIGAFQKSKHRPFLSLFLSLPHAMTKSDGFSKDKVDTYEKATPPPSPHLRPSFPNERSRNRSPLFVPLERRLQTLATLMYGVEPSLVIGFFIFLWSMPFLWPLLVAYLVWMVKDQAPVRGGRRLEWVRRSSFWKYFAAYFPVTIVKVRYTL